jgi:RNA-directed DNA polymerase
VQTKPFSISKHQVLKAFKLVKTNKGTSGVDGESLAKFEEDLEANLYKIWNRMSSGSYFPPAVKAVSIPKKSGGERVLGIPTVSDRIAQMVAKLHFEPLIEPHFLNDSYGYRPGKSALDAVSITRERCWKYGWVLEFDIKGLFDNIPHDLLMKAVRHHTSESWILIYIERWLKAPVHTSDGSILKRGCGTPQGGVISPLLSNLFLHYVFDMWMKRTYPKLPWCRYADDGLVHCHSQEQAEEVLAALDLRFLSCGLKLHPDKTKIVYCKSTKRKGSYQNTAFDFLGYTFKPRLVKNGKDRSYFVSFSPAVSKSSTKVMRDKVRKLNLHRKSDHSLEDIAKIINPVFRGWKNYFGRFYPTKLGSIWRHFNRILVRWAMRKHKKLRGRKTRTILFITGIAAQNPHLFVHWNGRNNGSFV